MHETSRYPIFDLHCDFLSYLVHIKGARPDTTDIGCGVPFLQQGNVLFQVMAIYTDSNDGSTLDAMRQADAFLSILHHPRFIAVNDKEAVSNLPFGNQTGIVLAIENASGFCEKSEPLAKGFEKLDALIKKVKKVFYIGITHHYENRFGGGNYTTVGLKDDGKLLLEYVSGRGIAIDLAHTSDALAYGILEHIDKKSLQVPIIASHSNFRTVSKHVRNLPDDLVKEIVKRGG